MLEGLFQGDYWISRFIIQRALGSIYLIAFIVALNQFRPLLGEKGLLPVPVFLKKAPFNKTPSIFHYHYSDRFFGLIAWSGIMLSLIALSGISDLGPVWVSVLIWLLLWLLYQSIVNVGQLFYSFGWESMLLEIGFYAIFLGPLHMGVPVLVIWLIRWMLFRVEFGAGLIKIRGDRCWRDLTCMYYHHETQPMPNPLSRLAHRTPRVFHRVETFFNHFVQLVVIWGIFAPQPIASVAAVLVIFSQGYLVLTGNYSWLNWLTIVLAFSGFSDEILLQFFAFDLPAMASPPLYFQVLGILMFLLVVYLSFEPVKNLLSRFQLMNYSFNPLHLVNTYGAFGSVTKNRYEIIVEGTMDDTINQETQWYEYEFKGKPGDLKQCPPQVAPYHLRLDWQIWFAAMNPFNQSEWFLRFVLKLLQNDKAMLKLLKKNPFPENPPKIIRAQRYLYQYTTRKEKKETGQWWKKTYSNEYLPPVSLEDFAFYDERR